MAIAGTLLPVAVKHRFAHRPAFASGIGVTGINIGAAVSSALAVPIAAAWEGWRGALAAFSLATLAICAGWLALSRGAWRERSALRPPRLPVRRPVAWFLVLAFGLPSAVYYGLVAWIADVYVERGWSDASVGRRAGRHGRDGRARGARRAVARRPHGQPARVDVVRLRLPRAGDVRLRGAPGRRVRLGGRSPGSRSAPCSRSR